jgi:hypothetical protein
VPRQDPVAPVVTEVGNVGAGEPTDPQLLELQQPDRGCGANWVFPNRVVTLCRQVTAVLGRCSARLQRAG